MMTTLRHLLAILILPGMAVVAAPYWLLTAFEAADTRWNSGSLAMGLGHWVGAIFIIIGLGLLIWCVSLFAKIGRGTLAPWDPTCNLVAAGPYRFVRNPMISGVALLLIGQAVFWGSWILGFWAGLFVAINHLYFLFSEEPGLEKRFGQPYRVYKTQVPRWIPRLRLIPERSKEQLTIEHSILIKAAPQSVWRHITEVDIASFRHPVYFSLLDIPKPLRAEVVEQGVGGARIAFFANSLRFSQEITEWQPYERYAFTFRADPGFRVGYLLDLSDGPFRLKAGSYRITSRPEGVRLTLTSQYELEGLAGLFLRIPVRLVLALFQRYLLKGIKTNAERQEMTLNQLNGGPRAEGNHIRRD